MDLYINNKWKGVVTMREQKLSFASIDEYISLFPADIQAKLRLIRKTIKQAAPEAIEKISYQMPTFYLNGNLVYFAAYKSHIGFYPTGNAIKVFEDDIKDFKTSKGTIQIPLDQELPLELIKKIVVFRVEENLQKKQKKVSK